MFLCIHIVFPARSTDEIYVSPFIYDVQNNIDTVICIKGLVSTMDMIKKVSCNVMDLDSRIVIVIQIIIFINFSTQLTINLSINILNVKIICIQE
jgi:hypothetical protein